MNNEYYGAPTTPNDDYLAHYGVKGMKWGVRRAVERGNGRALARQYRKASKKLAKLEKRAASGRNYARRAAALGAGAAGMGAIAATGTRGISSFTKGAGNVAAGALRGAGVAAEHASNAMKRLGVRGSGRMRAASRGLFRAGAKAQIGTSKAGRAVANWGAEGKDYLQIARNKALQSGNGQLAAKIENAGNKLGLNGPISNDKLTRIGAAAAGAGLAAGAGYNAYRAATTKKAAAKADSWRKEMNSAFAGTQYAGGQRVSRKKKRR